MTDTGIKVYSHPNSDSNLYAKDGDEWFVFPFTADGWKYRQPWNPAPAIEKLIARRENRLWRLPPVLAEQMLSLDKPMAKWQKHDL